MRTALILLAVFYMRSQGHDPWPDKKFPSLIGAVSFALAWMAFFQDILELIRGLQ